MLKSRSCQWLQIIKHCSFQFLFWFPNQLQFVGLVGNTRMLTGLGFKNILLAWIGILFTLSHLKTPCPDSRSAFLLLRIISYHTTVSTTTKLNIRGLRLVVAKLLHASMQLKIHHRINIFVVCAHKLYASVLATHTQDAWTNQWMHSG